MDPNKGLPVSEGVDPRPLWRPQFAHVGLCHVCPHPYFDDGEGLWIGGQFWDGRATGDCALGDPLADQALGPFLNQVEMNNPDKATVISGCGGFGLCRSVRGGLGLQVSLNDVEAAYDQRCPVHRRL